MTDKLHVNALMVTLDFVAKFRLKNHVVHVLRDATNTECAQQFQLDQKYAIAVKDGECLLRRIEEDTLLETVARQHHVVIILCQLEDNV